MLLIKKNPDILNVHIYERILVTIQFCCIVTKCVVSTPLEKYSKYKYIYRKYKIT